MFPPQAGTERGLRGSAQAEPDVDPQLERVLSREVVCWLAEGLKPLMSKAQQQCRLKRIAPTVQLMAYGSADPDDGEELSIEGVHTCKSALCPLCVRKWSLIRGQEIKQALDHWGTERALFWTGTVRHHQGMSIGLLVRVMRRAWGDMWSGHAGAEFAALMGGRPESVRSFEYVWSQKNGWHPHIHALWFCEDMPPEALEQLQQLCFQRWAESLGTALRSFRKFIAKVLDGKPCRWKWQKYVKQQADGSWVERTRRVGIACPQCAVGDECSHYKERATRLFGKKFIKPHVPLRESLKLVAKHLEEITEEAIMPDSRYGVCLERVERDGLDRYLSKLGVMGFELAGAMNKLGHEGKDGLMRYSHWEVGALACRNKDPLVKPARKAWKQLFWGTRGTQRIAFSDREKLGLGDDPMQDDLLYSKEPERLVNPGGTFRRVGEVHPAEWSERVEAEGHAWIGRLYRAWNDGKLLQLDGVVPTIGWHAVPSTRAPPETGPPPKPWWTRMVEESAHQRRTRAAWRSTWGSVRAREAKAVETERIREAGLSRLTLWRRKATMRDTLRDDGASKTGPRPQTKGHVMNPQCGCSTCRWVYGT